MTCSSRAIAVVGLLILGGGFAAVAAEPAPQSQSLPDPLTLDAALSLSDARYPALEQAQADLRQAEADRDSISAGNGIQASLQGRLRWIEPASVAPNQQHDDNHIGLYLTKRLYDFGRTESRLGAAESDVHGQELLYTDARARHRLAVMAAYFNVLLADLAYARDNEAMAVAYVTYDRMKDRRSQGEVSDIDVLQSQDAYQKARSKRYASDVRRRATRAKLALLLNHPGNLPANLVKPKLHLNRKLPDVEKLQAEALKNNPRIEALKAKLEAARQRIDAARADNRPVIDGEVETSAYSRELGSSDRVRAGITFKMPLYTSGAVQAEIGRAQAGFQRAQAQVAAAEMDVREAVLDNWQSVYVLNAKRDEARVASDYRDLYLDRSRALYELDVKTDLGDAMVQFTGVQWQQAQTDYELALALARLDALVGKPVTAPTAAAATGKP
jgi:outer membrane protein TolC